MYTSCYIVETTIIMLCVNDYLLHIVKLMKKGNIKQLEKGKNSIKSCIVS